MINFFKKKNNDINKNKKSFYYDDYSHENNIKTKIDPGPRMITLIQVNNSQLLIIFSFIY